MAIFGMLIAAWYNGLTTPKTGSFSFSKFINENANAIVYSSIGIILLVAVVGIAPETTDFIKTITGFDIQIPITNGGAVFIGGLIYELVRKSLK